MLTNIKAIIFDVDGTIADSMGMWKQIDVEYLGKFGLEVPKNLQKDIEGICFSDLAVYFKERFQIPDSLTQIKSDWNEMAAHKYRYEVPLKKGVLDFIKSCKEKGILLGIATSNSTELLGHFLEAYELHKYFDAVITGSDGLKGKPEPDMYLEAAKRLNILPENCLVFEDILPGIMAGKNAGMRVCAVEDAYSANIRAEKMACADYFIYDFEEILTT